MGPNIDYKVLFAFQKQILANKTLSAEEKIQMITAAIQEAEEGYSKNK